MKVWFGEVMNPFVDNNIIILPIIALTKSICNRISWGMVVENIILVGQIRLKVILKRYSTM